MDNGELVLTSHEARAGALKKTTAIPGSACRKTPRSGAAGAAVADNTPQQAESVHEQRYQVVIVGGGPVGVALALELGLRGVFLRGGRAPPRTQLIPKGQNLTQRAMEHFYSWGVADEVRASRMLPPEFPMSGIVAYRDLSNQYWYAPPLREIVKCLLFREERKTAAISVELSCAKDWRRSAASMPGSAGSRKKSNMTVLAPASPSSKAANQSGPSATCWKPTTWSAATAGHPSSATRSVSSAVERTSTKLMVLALFRSRELHED